MKSVGLVVHHGKGDASSVADALLARCREQGIRAVVIDADTVPDDVEGLVGVGGDGTVLRAAALALEGGLPVAGVNVGKVGYLAEFAVDEIEALAAALAADRLTVVERMTAAVRHPSGGSYAVNDVVLEKVVSQRVVEIGVEINGTHFARYRTDGIIVATPVGSTAYSLSAGGPVVDPRVDALVLTPVAPHSLLSRSLVLSADAVVRLSVEIDRPAQVNVDGREVTTIPAGGSVEVSRGDRRIRFLTLGRHPFPQAVRHQPVGQGR